MGMEIASADDVVAEERPGIFLVGSAGVGKTCILNRLRGIDDGSSDSSSSGVTCYSWKIDTKYYTANVGIWMATLEQSQGEESLRIQSLSDRCEALVMIFDLTNDSSFDCLKMWASRMDLAEFDILLCVGNKTDRVPQHYAHVEYRRRLQRRGESFSDPHPEFGDFGIERTEGSSLLSGAEDEEETLVCEKRQTRISWCIENGIEYIEACALNEAFDECLSLDGDLQGLSRIQGALSAHMWQGMVMKSTSKHIDSESQPRSEQGFSSDEDSDFTIEYELLSNSSEDEPFVGHSQNGSLETPSREEADDGGGVEVRDDGIAVEEAEATVVEDLSVASEVALNSGGEVIEAQLVSTTTAEEAQVVSTTITEEAQVLDNCNELEDESRLREFEQLMQEMAGIRDNLRTMPDAQRREMASQIALRMAGMFMDGEDNE